MEKERIAALLEKYWQVETTVEEEKILAEYFRGPNIPPEWESCRDIFSFYEEEKQIKMPSGIILPRPVHRMVWWAAAAVIILGLGISSLFKEAPPAGVAGIKDTYDDPRQALAAVQKALLTVSTKMNKGLHPLK